MICIYEVVSISFGNLDSSLWSIQPAFRMMYSAYELNKQGDGIQPCCTPSKFWGIPLFHVILTVAIWPVYRFLGKQVRWSGNSISKNFLQFVVVHTIKGFSVASEAKVYIFWNSHAFTMMQQILAIWSLVPSSFSESSLHISNFLVHIMLKPSWNDFEYNLASKLIRKLKNWSKTSNYFKIILLFHIYFVYVRNRNLIWPIFKTKLKPGLFR